MGIGNRFGDRHTGRLDTYTAGRRFIHVNIEPEHIGRIVPTDLGIVADAKLALQALLEEAKAQGEIQQQVIEVLLSVTDLFDRSAAALKAKEKLPDARNILDLLEKLEQGKELHPMLLQIEEGTCAIFASRWRNWINSSI